MRKGKAMPNLRAALLCASLAMLLPCDHLCAAQQSKQVPPAPVPSLILAAKKVFIANGGGDESPFHWPQYTGGPDRLYNEFYAALKSWGRYDLVDSPGEADLVFEIRLTNLQPTRSEPLKEEYPQYDSQFHLAIRDRKTHGNPVGIDRTCPNGHSPREPRQEFRAGTRGNPFGIAKNRGSGAGCDEAASENEPA